MGKRKLKKWYVETVIRAPSGVTKSYEHIINAYSYKGAKEQAEKKNKGEVGFVMEIRKPPKKSKPRKGGKK